jgi:hypothetical protein
MRAVAERERAIAAPVQDLTRERHIGLGAQHRGTRVVVLAHDVRVIDAATGELIRKLTIDPTKDYQALGRPPGPQPRPKRS